MFALNSLPRKYLRSSVAQYVVGLVIGIEGIFNVDVGNFKDLRSKELITGEILSISSKSKL